MDRIIEKEIEAEKEGPEDNLPKLDLKFKEGETIKVNLNIAKKSTSRPKPAKSTGSGILPPPPSGVVKTIPSASKGNDGDLDFGFSNLSVDSKAKQSSSNQETAPSSWAQF